MLKLQEKSVAARDLEETVLRKCLMLDRDGPWESQRWNKKEN